MKFKRASAGLAAIGLLLVVQGCGTTGDGAGGSDPTADEQAADRSAQDTAEGEALRVGFHANTLFGAPVLLAQEMGVWDDVNIEFVGLESGQAQRDGLASGDLDVAAFTEGALVSLRGTGEPIKAIAVLGYGGDRYQILVREDAPFEEVGDLSGKIIGSQDGGLGQVVCEAALEGHGVDPSTVQFADLEFVEQVSALEADSVDAICGVDPHTALALDRGIARSLATLGDYIMAPVMVTTTDASIEENSAQLEQYIAGFVEAVESISEDQSLAVDVLEEQFAEQGLDMSREIIEESVGLITWEAELSEDVVDAINTEVERQYEAGQFDERFEASDVIDRSFLP